MQFLNLNSIFGDDPPQNERYFGYGGVEFLNRIVAFSPALSWAWWCSFLFFFIFIFHKLRSEGNKTGRNFPESETNSG